MKKKSKIDTTKESLTLKNHHSFTGCVGVALECAVVNKLLAEKMTEKCKESCSVSLPRITLGQSSESHC